MSMSESNDTGAVAPGSVAADRPADSRPIVDGQMGKGTVTIGSGLCPACKSANLVEATEYPTYYRGLAVALFGIVVVIVTQMEKLGSMIAGVGIDMHASTQDVWRCPSCGLRAVRDSSMRDDLVRVAKLVGIAVVAFGLLLGYATWTSR